MNLETCISRLKKLSERSARKGYGGNAAEYAFREHTLRLLKEIAVDRKVKREPSKYNLHIAQEIAKGKTFLEAVRSYKKSKVLS